MKQGDFVYFIENNIAIKQVQVVRQSGGLVMIKFPNGGAIKVHRSRLYELKEDAEQKLSHSSIPTVNKRRDYNSHLNGQLL